MYRGPSIRVKASTLDAMPRAASVCAEPRCPNLAERRGRCALHAPPPFAGTGGPARRARGLPTTWPTIRARAIRRARGRCSRCRSTSELQVHHRDGDLANNLDANLLVGLLLGAALVSLLVGERIEATAIAAIVLLNALLGFVQEARAEGAVLALRDVLERRTTVVRSGQVRELPVERLVPGDLVVLGDGERVPADGRLVMAAGLAVDESTLTGESVPVDKTIESVPEETPLADRSSMVYAASAVTRGRGRALVTATGLRPNWGRSPV